MGRRVNVSVTSFLALATLTATALREKSYLNGSDQYSPIPQLQGLDLPYNCSSIEHCYGYNVRVWSCSEGACWFMKSTYTTCESSLSCTNLTHTECSDDYCQCVDGYGIGNYVIDSCVEIVNRSDRRSSQPSRSRAAWIPNPWVKYKALVICFLIPSCVLPGTVLFYMAMQHPVAVRFTSRLRVVCSHGVSRELVQQEVPNVLQLTTSSKRDTRHRRSYLLDGKVRTATIINWDPMSLSNQQLNEDEIGGHHGTQAMTVNINTVCTVPSDTKPAQTTLLMPNNDTNYTDSGYLDAVEVHQIIGQRERAMLERLYQSALLHKPSSSLSPRPE